MADLLLGIEAAHGGKTTDPGADSWLNLLSSHPATVSRAQRLKQGHVAAV